MFFPLLRHAEEELPIGLGCDLGAAGMLDEFVPAR